ncbi:hypothetical protein C8039_02090 [Halogeometricum sp. wsp3]|nr:hypothetical protein C8039_02090 [Halogeometricum sp. wsp3]
MAADPAYKEAGLEASSARRFVRTCRNRDACVSSTTMIDFGVLTDRNAVEHLTQWVKRRLNAISLLIHMRRASGC